MQTPPEQVPTLGRNRLCQFPKPVRPVPPKLVRPVPKTGQADFIQQTTPPNAKNAKEMHTLPFNSWDRLKGCNATFLHLSFSPLLPMHESSLKFENMQPGASQVYKIHHKMLHMSQLAS
jgi:hypothetical protein